MSRRGWRRRRSRGVANIIAQILLLAITIVIFSILFTFHFNPAPTAPYVNFIIKSGGSNPVWGDPTDEETGEYSLLNTTQIIISATSPTNLLLSDIEFTFECDNQTATGSDITYLVQGSLAAMTWFPGDTSEPAANAPTIGYCATFDAAGFGGGSNSVYYNRLGMFVPIAPGQTSLTVGDTFILYIHNGGYPLDYTDCGRYGLTSPCFDPDDYHGAPPWCFTSQTACTIILSYTGTPATTLVTIPVYTLAPPVA